MGGWCSVSYVVFDGGWFPAWCCGRDAGYSVVGAVFVLIVFTCCGWCGVCGSCGLGLCWVVGWSLWVVSFVFAVCVVCGWRGSLVRDLVLWGSGFVFGVFVASSYGLFGVCAWILVVSDFLSVCRALWCDIDMVDEWRCGWCDLLFCRVCRLLTFRVRSCSQVRGLAYLWGSCGSWFFLSGSVACFSLWALFRASVLERGRVFEVLLAQSLKEFV